MSSKVGKIWNARMRYSFYRPQELRPHQTSQEKSWEDNDDSVIDEFYTCLESVFDSLSSNDAKVVPEDFNIMLGKELLHHGTNGGHSLHDITNNNGSRLVRFASNRNMIIFWTYFPNCSLHNTIWTSPDGRCLMRLINFSFLRNAHTRRQIAKATTSIYTAFGLTKPWRKNDTKVSFAL
ncbi:uncharacterized protein LOC119649213 [Hermetia illucens]|uniref:uncharacterized protein LOC119649213 n=1 Tax=Hermetia illucens TaxID=343691 RepID=UPI0018CC1CA3|nr:uncharacterized protein LOC119649213 [Hermetia illucens]